MSEVVNVVIYVGKYVVAGVQCAMIAQIFRVDLISWFKNLFKWFHGQIEVNLDSAAQSEAFKWADNWVGTVLKNGGNMSKNQANQFTVVVGPPKPNGIPDYLFTYGYGKFEMKTKVGSRVVTFQIEKIRSTESGHSDTVSLTFDNDEDKKLVFDDMRASYYQDIKGKTQYFINEGYGGLGGNPWQLLQLIEPRKNYTTSIVQKRLLEEIRLWKGKPLEMRMMKHLGYLLHGPTGTGKQSFVAHCAAKFNMNIYRLMLSGLDEQRLQCVVQKIPQNSIVLLEECDDALKKQSLPEGALRCMLDGVESPPDTIFFLITNNIGEVDPSLFRQMRCKPVMFGYLDADTAADIFSDFFGEYVRRVTGEEKAVFRNLVERLILAGYSEISSSSMLEVLATYSHPDKVIERMQQILAKRVLANGTAAEIDRTRWQRQEDGRWTDGVSQVSWTKRQDGKWEKVGQARAE